MDHCKTNVVLSRDHIILSSGSNTLWCDRKDSRLTAGFAFHRDATLEYKDLGKIWGIIGKICFFTDGDWKLIVVTQADCVGQLPHGGEVYCVEKIGILPLTGTSTEIIGMELAESGLEQSLSGLSTSMSSRPTRPLSPVQGSTKTKEMREREKVEKRLTDALLGMFNDSQSFYFCLNSDLTQSLQRRVENSEEHWQQPLWQQMDERFFWNKWMLSDLLDNKLNDLELSAPWVFPLIQGYVEMRQIPVLCENTPTILQPGWSAQYREERDRILQECVEEHKGHRASRRRHESKESVEIEMRDMASLDYKEMLIPMQDMRPLSGSGYESDSEPSGSEDEPAYFSPLEFTSEVVDDKASNVRVIPAIKGTEVRRGTDDTTDQSDVKREDTTEQSGVKTAEDTANQSDAKRDDTTDQSDVKREDTTDAKEDTVDTTDQSERIHSQVRVSQASEQLSRLSPHQSLPVNSNQNPSVSQDSESTLYASSDGTKAREEREMLQDHLVVSQNLNDDSSTAGGVVGSTGDQVRTEEFPDHEKSTSTTSSLFYMTQEVPDVEDGVVIEIFESGTDGSPKKSPAKLPLASDETQEESQDGVTVHQFPDDLEAASPMGNPFLESEQEVKKVDTPSFTLAIISRRSCHRAGTRYKRRGVDPEGNVANYVETELVIRCGSHVVSYVIIRGSVPVFWSQPGNKYRPLPIIEKNIEETQEAFKKHFDKELELFKEMVAVNLVKQTGREKLVGDAFEQHVILMDNPLLSYVTFDFHQSFKENQMLALHKLLEGTAEFVKKFKFCWIDTAQSYGPLCKQEGVFRINCMDCLDRTNVVESILSRAVLQISLQKLGMIPFDEKLGGSTLISYQEMWGNNGDIISKQYAGTAAMKGDITRYGERKFTGLMKDGYNSAHRYYLNVFRDSYRQVLIDLMQGVNPSEAFSSLPRSMQGMDELDDGLLQSTESVPVNSTWSLEREMAMAEMIGVCKNELFPSMSDVPLSPTGLYGWVLMEAAGYSFLGDNKEEEPCVVMHSKADSQLCIAKFNMESKKILCFLRIPMSQIQKIVIGQLGIIIRSTKRLHMRIYYSLIHDTNFYFTFTTANCISMAEDRAILVSIAELLARMQSSIIVQEQKISKKKSLPHKGIIYLVLPESANSFPITSSTSVDGLKSKLSISEGRGSEEEEEGEELSLSAPSSPKLKSPMYQKRRHSCDDLLSDNTPRPSPDPSHLQETQPSITVTTPNKRSDENFVVPPLYLDDSSSESDLDISDSDNQLPTNLRTVNSLTTPTTSEFDGGDEEDDGQRANVGKFSKFKGKLLQTVKSTSSMLSRPRSRSPQPSNEAVRERSPSPTPVEGEAGKGLHQKVAVSKLRFKMNSPSLWRKMKKSSPVAPSEEELVRAQAQRNCKSRIIYIS